MPGAFFYDPTPGECSCRSLVPPSHMAAQPQRTQPACPQSWSTSALDGDNSTGRPSMLCLFIAALLGGSPTANDVQQLIATQTTAPMPPRNFVPITNGCQARCGEGSIVRVTLPTCQQRARRHFRLRSCLAYMGVASMLAPAHGQWQTASLPCFGGSHAFRILSCTGCVLADTLRSACSWGVACHNHYRRRSCRCVTSSVPVD